jgi:uncharacterized membrane protein
MAGRAISEKQRSWLMSELTSWQALGLLDPDQAARIAELYGSADEAAQRRGAQALFTLTSLGALLVGLAALLLIGYNWIAMDAAAKLSVVLGSLLAMHAVAFTLRYRARLSQASEIAFFLACLMYGAAIWLIAQIFHIEAGSADGFWWWALGVLPFALGLETLLLHALFVGLVALYAGFTVFGDAQLGPWLWRLPASGAYSVLPLTLPGLIWAYRKNSPRVVALYVPLIAWWVILQPFAWRFEANPVYFIGCVGGLLLLAAECHPEESMLAVPYRFHGALLAAGALIPLSYYSFQKSIENAGNSGELLIETVLAAVAGLILVLAASGRRLPKEDGRALPRVGAVFGESRRWLPLGLILFMAVLGLWNVLVAEPLIPCVLANLALVALAIWLMQVGLREDRGRPFSSGVLLFLLWTVLRYIDLFGDFGGMLGASMMFFLCGATLFGVAHYWRRRKGLSHA